VSEAKLKLAENVGTRNFRNCMEQLEKRCFWSAGRFFVAPEMILQHVVVSLEPDGSKIFLVDF
jgi:hypothetical protein